MEVIGKVHHLGEEQQITAAYNKRELVIKTDEQFSQYILIEFGQGKCNEYLDKLNHGDNVKVSINLRGREWVNPQGETKYFNSIQGWRIEKVEGSSAPKLDPQPNNIEAPSEEETDLPF